MYKTSILLFASVIGSLCLSSTNAFGGERPVRISIEDIPRNKVAIYSDSGWPLDIRLRIRDPFIGFSSDRPGIFPFADFGFRPTFTRNSVILTDPDNCPSEVQFAPEPNGCPDPIPPAVFPVVPVDEENIPFSAGVSTPELFSNVDVVGAEARPTLNSLVPLLGTLSGGLGPYLGSVEDDYGFGASVRIPGLVVVSDTGIGVVTNGDFDRNGVLQCRNLAGFANSVSQTLNDGRGNSDLQIHFNVPRDLFSPIILVDAETAAGTCPAGKIYSRVESGAEQCLTQEQINDYYDQHIVTVRAFVVSLDDIGSDVPPDIITDWNGNGRCDRRDLILAGYRSVSGMSTRRFQQLHSNDALDVGFEYAADLDGNGLPEIAVARFSETTPSFGRGRRPAPR